jgi:hypothetical protein
MKADKPAVEPPPYTLPREGIAQSRTFLFLPNTYGVITFEPAKAYKQKMRWLSQRIKNMHIKNSPLGPVRH